MRGRRICNCRRWRAARIRANCAVRVAVIVAGLACRAQGTGFYGPHEFLGDGGGDSGATPEFYWDQEVKRIARQFHPTEKLYEFKPTKEETAQLEAAAKSKEQAEEQGNYDKANEAQGPTVFDMATGDADKQDFAAAIKEGGIKPPNPDKAVKQNDAARAALFALSGQNPPEQLPEEFDSEFADYHRGAFAFRQGQDHWDDAIKAFQALLNRPAEQRHYRSVWAAFMLGKIALKKGDYAKAVEYFEQTRKLAKEGFADSIGMAADSYGWEGRAEWKQDHPEKAAPLFLTQLALGDESAVVSLKALIPDRDPVDGMLNYGPEADDMEKWTDQQKKDYETKSEAGLKVAAADPLLRRLVTAHILATLPIAEYGYQSDNDNGGQRAKNWLAMLRAAKAGKVEDAEYLGWLAYSNGDYKEAAHWLSLADPATPASCWLQSKLQLRDGKIAAAAESMAKAWENLRDEHAYTGWVHGDRWREQQDDFWAGIDNGSGKVTTTFEWQSSQYIAERDEPSFSFQQSAAGDLGLLRLTRADFTQALDTLLKGNLWEDAAYVAERVLTVDELKAYVDKQPVLPAPSRKAAEIDWGYSANTHDLRYLLARRLVREDRYDEAAAYMEKPYDRVLAKYAQALKDGANEKLPKEKRARAWFTAAWIARYDGMEIMGTEVAPDGFIFDGEFESTDIAAMRESQTYQVSYEVEEPADGGATTEVTKTKTLPFDIKVSKQELARLAKSDIAPDIRFHYRVIAGALAMKAAALLPDNTEELADVVNEAGNWIKESDDKLGDRYYNVIEKRAAKTKIGREAIAKHWFVDDEGPWSGAEQAAHDAMLKSLGIQVEQ